MYFTNCNIKTNSDLNPVYYNVLGTAQVPLGTVPRLIGVPRLTYLPVLGMAKNSAQVVMLNQGCAVYMGFYCTLIIFFQRFSSWFQQSLCFCICQPSSLTCILFSSRLASGKCSKLFVVKRHLHYHNIIVAREPIDTSITSVS